MRKFIVAVVATLALFTTGCTIQVESKPSDTPSASVSATPKESPDTTVEDPDALFLSVVREEYPQLKGAADADLIQIAKDACTMLGNGADTEQLFNVFGNSGNSDADEAIAFLIGAGIVAYCPEYVDQISPGPNT
jgi:hypothetical protein